MPLQPGALHTPEFAYARWIWFALIMLVATGLRTWHLGSSSLWYDEVVTMREASAPNLTKMIGALETWDATRAPLFPLLLMGWTRVWGASDLAARSLPALLGVMTVAAVYGLGRRAFSDPTGRWAAWLCALCPTLVRFSQEVRMYALLVFLTVCSWWLLVTFRHSASWRHVVAYAAVLTAVLYTHPLGVLILLAHGVAFVVTHRRLALSAGRFVAAVGLVALAITPWLGRYFNHPPEYFHPRLPIRFLIGLPIEYVGGNALTLLPMAALVAIGLVTRSNHKIVLRHLIESAIILCWFLIPPVVLYAYSQFGHPIFGPSRYNVFVAPAYLLLVACGLAALPRLARWSAAALMLILTIHALASVTYEPGVKVDWRSLAARVLRDNDNSTEIVIHAGPTQYPRTQSEVARYYLGDRVDVRLAAADHEQVREQPDRANVYHVFCESPPQEVAQDYSIVARFRGLILTRRSRVPPASAKSAGTPES